MRLPADYTGARFGSLLVLGNEPNTGLKMHSRNVKVQCNCGNQKTVRLDAIKAGATVSCGCKRSAGRWKANPESVWFAAD